MIAEAVRTMYEYNAWANTRILDTAEHVTAEQLLAGGGASFDSLRDTLVHAMSAQWLYLERWRGRSPRAFLDPKEFPDVASIRRRWDEIERETQAFVAGLSDAQLARNLEYTNMTGRTLDLPALAADASPGQPRDPASQRGRGHADPRRPFSGLARFPLLHRPEDCVSGTERELQGQVLQSCIPTSHR